MVLFLMFEVAAVVVGGGDDGVARVQLLEEHGLDDESQWHSGILYCVHEESGG